MKTLQATIDSLQKRLDEVEGRLNLEVTYRKELQLHTNIQEYRLINEKDLEKRLKE